MKILNNILKICIHTIWAYRFYGNLNICITDCIVLTNKSVKKTDPNAALPHSEYLTVLSKGYSAKLQGL
jgi:hypothetical protein